MDLALTADHRDLHEVADSVLADQGGLRCARSVLDDPSAPDQLARTVAALDWYTVGLDGDPLGVPGLACLAQRCGRVAAPIPLVDAAVATGLAVTLTRSTAAHGETAATCVTRIAAGGPVPTLALLERGGSWSAADLAAATITPEGAGYRISAHKVAVSHGDIADILAVVGRVGDEPAVAFVERGAPA